MFVNQGNGTFKDELKESTGHLSYYSMGCDIADINNDGYNGYISCRHGSSK